MLSSLMASIVDAAAWVAHSSVQAALIVLLILALQWLGRRLFSARASVNLWLILLLHLVLPWTPSSSLSVYRWLPLTHPATPQFGPVGEPAIESAMPANEDRAVGSRRPALFASRAPLAAFVRNQPLTVTWLCGVAVLGGVLLMGLWSERRRFYHTVSVDDPEVLALLEECRHEAGIHRPVRLEECGAITGPVALGIRRPRILMPVGLIAQLTPENLRHIFLHEMAHIRRRDIPLSMVMNALLVIHWFNPLLWLASHRLRVDRELACDAFVLRPQLRITPAAYGRTMIYLLEQCQRPAVFPNAAGILEYKSEMKRRIAMISQHQNTPRWREVVSATACVMFACLVLSRPADGQPAAAAGSVTTTVASNGHYEDTVNLPFIYDARVVGVWQSVDFVANPAAFDPVHPQSEGELFLKELVFQSDGKTNTALTWTAGYVLHTSNKTASAYEIFSRDGRTYMAMQWKSGDYIVRHRTPAYYILQQVSSVPPIPPDRKLDDTNLPFADDPAVIGRWRSVDFVRTPDEFVPGRQQDRELFLKQLVFMPNGAMSQQKLRWTHGFVLNPSDHTASAYEIRQIGRDTFLFFEWKSGDYVYRGMKPQYYVLQKVD